VRPIRIPANTVGRATHFGVHTLIEDIEITPDGKTAYAVISVIPPGNPGSVTPVNIATNHAGQKIGVGNSPRAIAFTP